MVIIGLYSRGMTTTDIEEQMKEIYGLSISSTTVSNVTNKLLVRIKEWQSRPLEQVYFTVWMDGIRVKVRHKGKIVDKTVYLVIGLNNQGRKEVLGMWIDESESASFWPQVLSDMKSWGVTDIFIACTDTPTPSVAGATTGQT